MKKLHRLAAARIYGRPLMMESRKLDVILHVLAPRLDIEAPEVEAGMLSDSGESEGLQVVNGVAIIDVCGSLVNRMDVTPMSGMRSYEEIAGEVEDAATDPGVRSIVMRFDSCGGEVSGVFDLAKLIRQAAAVKPIIACVDDSAYSAAYALASACSEIVVTQTSGVGSIGVIAVHVDQSQLDQKLGVKFTPIFAGSHKNDFSQHAPLSDAARERLQQEIDGFYEQFCSLVAANRGMRLEAVKATNAACFTGAAGVAAGLADRVSTFRDVLAEEQVAATPVGAGSRSMVRVKTDQDQPDITDILDDEDDEEDDTTEVPAVPSNSPETTSRAASAVAEIDKETGMDNPTQAAPVQDAAMIADLCIIAGRPELAAEFITENVSVDQARTKLRELNAKNQGAEISAASNRGNSSVVGKVLSMAQQKASGNSPVAVGMATLEVLKANPALYDEYATAHPWQFMSEKQLAMRAIEQMGGLR